MGTPEVLEQPDIALGNLVPALRAHADLIVKKKLHFRATGGAGQIADDILQLFPAEILARTFLVYHGIFLLSREKPIVKPMIPAARKIHWKKVSHVLRYPGFAA